MDKGNVAYICTRWHLVHCSGSHAGHRKDNADLVQSKVILMNIDTV